jgi:hypothetical protein
MAAEAMAAARAEAATAVAREVVMVREASAWVVEEARAPAMVEVAAAAARPSAS